MFAVSTAGDRSAAFRLNGATTDAAPYGAEPALNGTAFLLGCCFAFGTIHCNGTTDYIELWAGQNTGGTLATGLTAGNANSMMTIEWVAP
jgi:hypothetical protein